MGAKLPQPGWRVRCDPLETLTPATGALHGPATARGQLGSLFSPCSSFSRRSLGALREVGGTLGPRATGLGEAGPFQGPHGEARAPARSDTSLRCEGSAAEARPLGPLFRVLPRSPPRRARLQGQEEGGVPETRFPAPSLPQHGTGRSSLLCSVESACPGVHRPSGFFQAQAPEDRSTFSPALSLCPKGPAGGRRAHPCPSVLF